MPEPNDATRQVEHANAEFYRAFAECDLAHMDRLWSDGAHVRCVHPGWDILEGWPAVRRSWERIFAGLERMPIHVAHVQARASGGVGWVSCVEQIVNQATGGSMVNSVLATNVFERDDGGRWRLVQHHASPVLVADRRAAPPRDELN